MFSPITRQRAVISAADQSVWAKMRSSLIFAFLLAIFAAEARGLCPAGKLSCDDGTSCISSDEWCDKITDCDDKSDEAYCEKKGWLSRDPNDCIKTHFLCNNGRCIPKSAECNGHHDCIDNSDESNCHKPEEIEEPETSEESENDPEPEENEISSEKSIGNFDEVTDKTTPIETQTSTTTTFQPEIIVDEFKSPTPSPNYYEKKMTDFSSIASRTYLPTRSTTAPSSRRTNNNSSRTHSQGNYYPPPPPTNPRQTPQYPPVDHGSNPGRTPGQQFPSTLSGYPGQQTQHNYRTQPAQHSPTDHRQQTQYSPGDRRHPTQYSPDDRRQPTQYSPGDHRQQTQYSPEDRRQPTQYAPGDHRQQTQYSPDDRRQPTQYAPGDHRQPTQYSPDDRRQQTQYSPGYHRPPTHNYPQGTHTAASPPYQEFHKDVIPPAPFERKRSRHVPDYNGQRKALPKFTFLQNFDKYRNAEAISSGVQWILGQREPSRGWDKDTARALVALSLVNNSFVSGLGDNDSMKLYLNLQLGLKLLSFKELRHTELAHFVLALLATCQDPSDFQGVDLGRTLLDRRSNHHPFTLLAACLAGRQLGHEHLNDIITNTRATPNTEQKKDKLSLSLSALSCYLRSNPSEKARLGQILQEATSKLLELKLDDDSFGSIYSTAIAAQALMSLNDSLGWKPAPTIRFLTDRQNDNGSFGDFLSTYYVLPVLSGRSLLHLRNTRCTPKKEELTPREILDYPGEKQYLQYSLYFGYPLENAYSVQMLVPVGINFYDVMRVAEYQNKHFKFQFDKLDDKIKIFSISDVPNDAERGLAWHLYIKRGSHANLLYRTEAVTEDVKTFRPRSNEHFVFWYHYSDLRPQH